MVKKYRLVLFISMIMILAPMGFGFVYWNQLPLEIPAHFNIMGEVDGVMPKTWLVIGFPLSLLLLEYLFLFLIHLDTKHENIKTSSIVMISLTFSFISMVISGFIYSRAFGYAISMTGVLFLCISIIFMILSIVLNRSKEINEDFGLRTPWALEHVDNWRHTQKLASKSFFLGGGFLFIMAVTAFLGLNHILVAWMSLISLLIAIFIPVVGSYQFFKKYSRI